MHKGIKCSEDNQTYYIWTSTFTMNINIINCWGVNKENMKGYIFFFWGGGGS